MSKQLLGRYQPSSLDFMDENKEWVTVDDQIEFFDVSVPQPWTQPTFTLHFDDDSVDEWGIRQDESFRLWKTDFGYKIEHPHGFNIKLGDENIIWHETRFINHLIAWTIQVKKGGKAMISIKKHGKDWSKFLPINPKVVELLSIIMRSKEGGSRVN